MAIQSDPLSFELTFVQSERVFHLTQFSNDERKDFDPVLQLTENLNVQVRFECDDEDARFYMDGLEMLPERTIEVDENRIAYLPPSEDLVTIFKNNNEYYPLIPGFYRVTVEAHGTRFHTVIQVVPKQMTVEQWEIMRDELEAELRGLAQDLIRKNLGMGQSDLKALPVDQLYRFLVIRQHFPAVVAALHDLTTKINSRIRKDYRMFPIDQAKAIDQVTIRHRLTHPENTESLKSPVREVDYNLPENQWVCRIVRVVNQYLEEIMSSLSSYNTLMEEELRSYRFDKYVHDRDKNEVNVSAFVREKHKVMEALSAFSETALKMKHSLQLIKLAHWYPTVSQTVLTPIPPVFKYDSRYRALYQLYRDLKSNKFEIELDSSYAYQWKRTDRLYEMWGFLKICKMLTGELGFDAKGGWLYDLQFEGNRLLIPTLPSDTTIVLEKEDVRLHLIYNSVLPPKNEAKSGDVLCMNLNFHDHPDGRLDVYKHDIYAGSLIIDFKYRPLQRFWDPNKRTPSQRPAATNQLLSYHSDSTSSHLFGDLITDAMRRQLRPVLEVWAIYPTGKNESLVDFNEQHSVRLIKACPGEPDDHLVGELQSGIDRVVHFFEDITSRQQ